MMARGVTVSGLNKYSKRSIVNVIIQEQITVIDNKISIANESGLDNIVHELPINFQINNMDKADAQTMIYSELIKIYSEDESKGGKGFKKTYISFDTKAYLRVFWLNGMNEAERAERNKLIRSHAL
jgi:hypothetical protein